MWAVSRIMMRLDIMRVSKVAIDLLGFQVMPIVGIRSERGGGAW